MQSEPLVSVITPTRNRPSLLRLAYESLQRQTLQDFEFVISVNGRNASSLAEAHRIRLEDNAHATGAGREGRVRVLYNARYNYYEAMNCGFKASRGRFIHFLSDDDLLEPTFLETCCGSFADEPRLEVVGVDHTVLEDSSKAILQMPCLLTNSKTEAARNGVPALGAYVINCSMFGRSLLERMDLGPGPFDPSFHIKGDEDFFIRLSKTGTRALHICAPLMQYRVHPYQVTQTREIRHFFEGTRILRATNVSESSKEIVSRLAWSANRMTRFLGTRIKRKMGLRVKHKLAEIDKLRWPALRA